MNNDRELMQDALDALNNFDKGNHGMRWQVPLINALRARLAQPEPAECDGGQCGIGGYCKQCPKTQPEQEPVAWADKVDIDRDGHDLWVSRQKPAKDGVPLYTAPPQREWVGLTDEEIREGNKDSWVTRQAWESAAWWAEAKLKEKNT